MASYTYTDISVGFFPKAADIFKAYRDKMTFKLFDVEKTPSAQGYENNSYDIVIASNVLHATESLHTTLVNTRKLLKPGGYLLLLEITNNEPIRTGFIWGTLAGWWAGVNDGRRWAPTITPGMWHSALRKAGFAGVDAVTPEIDGIAWPFSIMAAQAVDDRIQFLRQPLSSRSAPVHIESLVILGNKSLETARLSEELADQLRRFCGDLIILDGLPTEEESLDITPMSTFINLVDLDEPIFKDIMDEQMEGLKRMFELAKNVLWITQGALVEQPYHMASITFSRVIRREIGYVSLNHLDISDIQQPDVPKVISQHLLQTFALDEWETSNEQSQFLWSKEPEAFLDHGKLMLPRLVSGIEQNARLNAYRRTITKDMLVSASNVAIIPPSIKMQPKLVEPASLRKERSANLHKVDTSSLMAINVLPDVFLFLAVGKDDATGRPNILLSTTNSMEVAPTASSVVQPEGSYETGQLKSTSRLLVAAASELLAESLVQRLATGSHVMVHCSAKDRFLIAALSRRSSTGGVRVTYTCDKDEGDDAIDGTWVKLSARESKYTVKKTIQLAKPTHFLDLTSNLSGTNPSDISLRISQALPKSCKRIDVSSLVQDTSALPASFDFKALAGRLEDAVSGFTLSATKLASLEQVDDLVVPADSLGSSEVYHATSAVQWPSDGLVKVEIRPLETTSFFSKEKTYLLIGLSGKIGQSITEWMVANGAGCVCLTSRLPAIDDKWLKSFEGTGATVKVYSMDVTNMRNVQNVMKDIRAQCPPIAGLANGAMVLHDGLFSKMPTDKMQQVLGPKIDGSNNLDQIFYNDNLDFFVLFSSAACVVGNVGQANYAAANGYINSLVRQRRRRGLAASTFDIGVVASIGYIETAGQRVKDQLGSLGLRALSETDLREAFAETIRTGRPDPKDKSSIPDAVLTTGIRRFSEDEDIKGPWFTNSFFSHCVINSKTVEVDVEGQEKKSNIPAARQLVKATTREQALEILQGQSFYDINGDCQE